MGKKSINEDAARIEALETELLALQDENEALRRKIDTMTFGSSLIIQSAPARKLPAELPIVNIGGKEYKFKIPTFRIDGKVLTATDVAADPALLAVVVEKYPGLVAEL